MTQRPTQFFPGAVFSEFRRRQRYLLHSHLGLQCGEDLLDSSVGHGVWPDGSSGWREWLFDERDAQLTVSAGISLRWSRRAHQQGSDHQPGEDEGAKNQFDADLLFQIVTASPAEIAPATPPVTPAFDFPMMKY